LKIGAKNISFFRAEAQNDNVLFEQSKNVPFCNNQKQRGAIMGKVFIKMSK